MMPTTMLMMIQVKFGKAGKPTVSARKQELPPGVQVARPHSRGIRPGIFNCKMVMVMMMIAIMRMKGTIGLRRWWWRKLIWPMVFCSNWRRNAAGLIIDSSVPSFKSQCTRSSSMFSILLYLASNSSHSQLGATGWRSALRSSAPRGRGWRPGLGRRCEHQHCRHIQHWYLHEHHGDNRASLPKT